MGNQLPASLQAVRGRKFETDRLRPRELEGKTRWELMGVDLSQDDRWRRHRADLDAHRPFRAFRYSMVDKAGQPLHLSISSKPIGLGQLPRLPRHRDEHNPDHRGASPRRGGRGAAA